MKKLIQIMMVALIVSSASVQAGSDENRALGGLMAYNEKCEAANAYGIGVLTSMSEESGYSTPSELSADVDFADGYDTVMQEDCGYMKVVLKRWEYYEIFKQAPPLKRDIIPTNDIMKYLLAK